LRQGMTGSAQKQKYRQDQVAHAWAPPCFLPGAA
jgi:hypothetical protein